MLSINQPYFFPNLGYFLLIKNSNKHVFLNDVNMKKKSWITRNKFTDEDTFYSLKLHKLSQNRKIFDHLIVEPEKQLNEFRQYFVSSNKEDAFIDETLKILIKITEILEPEMKISDLNEKSVKIICEALSIKTKFYSSVELNFDSNVRGSDKLIMISHLLKDYDYLNLESGIELYDRDYFKSKGVSLFFNTASTVEYPSNYNGHYKSILKIISKFGIINTKYILGTIGALDE